MRILSILVMLAALAGLWFYGLPLLQERESGTTQAAGSEKALLFPDLADRINDVRQLRIESAGETIEIDRAEDGSWGMTAKSGYPADAEQVLRIVADLKSPLRP